MTTVAGARRLGGGAVGLGEYDATTLEAPGKPTITVTGTPCRHGPPLSRPLVGQVDRLRPGVGGPAHGQLWISGDTVLYGGVKTVADRVDVGTAIVHLGGVRFPVSGPLRYTMTGAEGAELCALLEPATRHPRALRGGGSTSARGGPRPSVRSRPGPASRRPGSSSASGAMVEV